MVGRRLGGRGKVPNTTAAPDPLLKKDVVARSIRHDALETADCLHRSVGCSMETFRHCPS